jgi:aryl-alcohol dehydrogenase-like predicted oxidoreductase
MVDEAIGAGINFFDTANVYNDGASEAILGKALAGRRHRVIVATKVCGKMGEAPDQRGLSRAAIFRAVEESLRRLGTDYLDVYYLHQPDYETPVEETLDAMEDLVRQGKVRYPATSNFAAWQVARLLWLAEKNGYRPALIAQPMYNLLARAVEQEFLPMCKELGVSTVCYNPLAGGLLTGKHPRQVPREGSRFARNKVYVDRYWNDDQHDAVEALARVAAREGRSLIAVALHWLLCHTAADCVLLGASSIEQLRENLAAVESAEPLTENTLKVCDVIWGTLRGVAPKYNR